MFVDQKKNCNTKKKTICDLRKWYGWCNQLKRMAASAGLSGKKTNNSARKTMVTCLTKNSVPETQIIQLTGHKNLQSLNSYKKASLQQQKEMSHVLSSYKKPETNPSSSYPTTQSSEPRFKCSVLLCWRNNHQLYNKYCFFPTATQTQSFTTMSAAPK